MAVSTSVQSVVRLLYWLKITSRASNVWNIRKEQMAARALTQPRPPAAQSSAPALLSPPPTSSQESPTSSITPIPASTSPAAPTDPVATSSTATVPSTTNGHLAPHPGPEYDDPFVVKPGRSPSTLNPSPPAIDDKDSWPEVGHAAATPPNGKKEGREEEDRGHEREPSQGNGSKKSTSLSFHLDAFN